MKMQAFVIDMIQSLYRIWKTGLHYYYKSPKRGKKDEERMRNPPADLPQDQWEYYVKRFSSTEFKVGSHLKMVLGYVLLLLYLNIPFLCRK